MATFVTTIEFTERGIADVAQTTQRAEAFKAEAEKMGATVKEILWTLGPFDGLFVFDAPDEETATALLLHLRSLGNVRTQSGRAFNKSEMNGVLSKLTA